VLGFLRRKLAFHLGRQFLCMSLAARDTLLYIAENKTRRLVAAMNLTEYHLTLKTLGYDCRRHIHRQVSHHQWVLFVPAMLRCVMFAGLFRMMDGVGQVTVRYMGMMPGFFMITRLVVLGCHFVMPGMSMVLNGFAVVFGGLL
jgi:hypothetical protein